MAVTQGQALAPDMTVAVMQATRGGLKLGFVDTGFTSLHTREVNMGRCSYAPVVTNPSTAPRTVDAATRAGPVDAAVAVTQGQALAPDMTVAVMQATRGGLTLYAKLGFVDTGFTSLHTREVNMGRCSYAPVVTNPSTAIRTGNAATRAGPVDAAVAVTRLWR